MSRRDPLARRTSIRIEELHGRRMVVREEGSTARKVMDAAFARARVEPVIVMELGSREAIREAVAKGIGIGTVAQAAYVPDPRLRMLRMSNTDAATDTHVYCLRVRRGARVVRAFMDIAGDLALARLPQRRRRSSRGTRSN